MVKQLAQIFENLKGEFSGNMDLFMTLDSEMNPVLNTMQASGKLSTHNLSLSNVKAIDDIADAIKIPSLKNIEAKHLSMDFTIENGRLLTKPFDIKWRDYSLNLSGSTGLDQTIDYTGKLKLPASAGSFAKLGTVDFKIGGTFKSPKVSLDTQSMVKQATKSASDTILRWVVTMMVLDNDST